MTYYVVIFAAGFAGSFHCIGMCGGFACALGRDPRGGAASVERHLLYNVGRLTTYCFLGGLAGALGQVLSTSHGVAPLTGSLDTAQRILAIVAGVLMIAMALQFFGLFHGFHRAAIGFGGSTLAKSLRSLLATRSQAAPIGLGVLNGFLPCPLVYAFAAQAASTAAPLPGLLVMLAFGLGTFPAMLMMGGVGRLLAPAWRQRGVWLAGSCILLLGLVTLGRGIVPLAYHAHAERGWEAGNPG
ncbi:MAG TPA: sulfite exporter TauE/SafE family protein [Aestuariivirgaceae bacterium]|nr:sulfite exporter TauE/SafE family protein [Aestuariivirgaceae bacterium]